MPLLACLTPNGARKRRASLRRLMLLAGVLVVSLAHAGVADHRRVIGAGGHADGGGLHLDGTLHEPAVGVQSGGEFQLVGGFHTPRNTDALFRNGFEP